MNDSTVWLLVGQGVVFFFGLATLIRGAIADRVGFAIGGSLIAGTMLPVLVDGLARYAA